MSKSSAARSIRLRGVRHNNLKNFDLDLPVRQLVVITGLSGSGKSSLAFDTLFAEGQRRYIETFSPYARQFFDRMDKPQVDRIDGIPPAIAIEQRNTVRTTRSTVGTMTELCDYLKLLWPHLAQLHCRQCGQPVRKDPPANLWEWLQAPSHPFPTPPDQILVTFDLPLSDRLSLEDSLALVSRQGYQRLLLESRVVRLEEALPHLRQQRPAALTVVQDRIRVTPQARARFVEACEQAYHFGHGRLALHATSDLAEPGPSIPFSNRLHCAACNLEYRDPTPALFSFNHPLGACPACRGFGRIISIDYRLALPDPSKTLAQGVVKPWQTGQGRECQTDLMAFCRKRKAPTDVPFERLSTSWQTWVLEGDPDYGKDDAHRWPRAWYGVAGYFRWLESKSYKMHVRVLLSRYRSYSTCPACQGRRFQPESLLYKVAFPEIGTLTLGDFYRLPITNALAHIRQLIRRLSLGKGHPLSLVLREVGTRLSYLDEVGLGYLTLDRPTRTLSGGETERVNLTSCLGSRLVNTLFVLDEPSVGLHARDTLRLVRILQHLRDAGNTVVVVEHEASVIRAANQIVDLGPGQGEAGGQVLFQGPVSGLLRHSDSLTARYLKGTQHAALPAHRPVLADTPRLVLSGARRHNLVDLTVAIPLNRLVCLTGVSGSGKTTLARDLLYPALQSRFQSERAASMDKDLTTGGADTSTENATLETDSSRDTSPVRLSGFQRLGRVALVDQSPLGRTSRSNPAVYVGAFDDIRELYAQTELARQRGLSASAFSFNSTQGQCERCRGAGFEKIEMQFLSDVQIRCPDCQGHRYRAHILEIRLPIAPSDPAAAPRVSSRSRDRSQPRRAPASVSNPSESNGPGGWTIAQMLEATADEAVRALQPHAATSAGRRALGRLRYLQEVGLGYLHLGQPVNTLSGGESQRLKLAAHLAEQDTGVSSSPALFIFDEPTTGLHFHDVHVLLKAFQRLVQAGHSLLVIEHNLDVIRSADWVIDLGPEGGEGGGRLVVAGTPEDIARCEHSHTGAALRDLPASAVDPRLSHPRRAPASTPTPALVPS